MLKNQSSYAAFPLLLAFVGSFALATIIATPKTDDFSLDCRPAIAVMRAQPSIKIRVRNPKTFWCPSISIDINDGAYVEGWKGECPDREEGDGSWFVWPETEYRTLHYWAGEGKHTIVVELEQNGKKLKQQCVLEVQ